jgi:hypothetical protein
LNGLNQADALVQVGTRDECKGEQLPKISIVVARYVAYALTMFIPKAIVPVASATTMFCCCILEKVKVSRVVNVWEFPAGRIDYECDVRCFGRIESECNDYGYTSLPTQCKHRHEPSVSQKTATGLRLHLFRSFRFFRHNMVLCHTTYVKEVYRSKYLHYPEANWNVFSQPYYYSLM